MANSNKVANELRAAVQKMNQALRAYGSGRPDHRAAADCFNRLMAAISDIDERLVALEESQEGRPVSGEAT
ncbi:hypothetical protein K5D33_07280 [Pseudomonas cichorii]|nr:hypothetical protein [Pseudomonas cichorii]MBX8534525.1 hypothetical protein [Pseudomonas cichorii]